MSRLTRRQRLMLLVVAMQVVALLGVAALHGARIASGTIVRVEVTPVDPLDLARGAYSELRYGFTDLSVPKGHGDAYVLLQRPTSRGEAWKVLRVTDDAGDLDEVDAWITLPRDGGELTTDSISTYYADADTSKELDRELASRGALAELSLDEDGDPSLVKVVPKST